LLSSREKIAYNTTEVINMLLRFSIENFLSFNQKEQFSMSPGKLQRHKNHTINYGKRNVLKASYVYGANASGKSNLIRAISFAKDIIRTGIENVDLSKKHFRIQPENYHKPSIFQFELIIKDTVYSYGFAISFSEHEILDEWLYEINESSEKCIFSRETNDGSTQIESQLNLKGSDKDSFNVYIKDIKRMKKSLFLSEIAKKGIDDTNAFLVFNEVYDWFSKLLIIFPNSKYRSLNKIASNEEMRSEFTKYLNYFDTGIEGVLESELDFDKALSELDDETRLKLKNRLSNDLNNNEIIGIRGGNLMLYLNKNNTGEIIAKKMVLSHGNPLDLFDYTDESDGTKRLFDLIPLFFGKLDDTVILIDEIDRSLHTRLTSEFIDLFYKLSENNRSQLIVTTHDASLMDLDKIRQDEIWFIERRKDHSSCLYSLDKFKARYDKKVEKDYLIGRYGAVPVFNSFSNFNEIGVNENGQ
jgi:uncharacterized protein